MSETNQFDFPSQTLDLPSRGLLYPETSPLSTGTIEIKMPTAVEEDILTNASFLEKGIVFDKLLKSIIVNKNIDPNELLLGDYATVLLAFRILAFGSDYVIKHDGDINHINLSTLKEKDIDPNLYIRGQNEFSFETPSTKTVLTFKLLTRKDEKAINDEIKGIQSKLDKTFSGDVTIRLKHTILSVNGDSSVKTVREYVDRMPIRDSRALRSFISVISPDHQMKCDFTKANGEVVEDLDIPITVDFFWPK